MAIARGAGTEIIRSHHFEDIDSTTQLLIVGVQHHIYTVLSIIIYAKAIATTGNVIELSIFGYDSKAGTTAQEVTFLQQSMNVHETFVWNEKIVFNGFEPTDFSGPLDDAAKQNAIADQGSSVVQSLRMATEAATDGFEVTCTFIDQNNA